MPKPHLSPAAVLPPHSLPLLVRIRQSTSSPAGPISDVPSFSAVSDSLDEDHSDSEESASGGFPLPNQLPAATTVHVKALEVWLANLMCCG